MQMWKQVKTLVPNKKENLVSSLSLINFLLIVQVAYDSQLIKCNNLIKFRKINIAEPESIAKQMKSKSNHECVSNKIIIHNWNVLGNVLHRLINTS